jgi:hypothetical protein
MFKVVNGIHVKVSNPIKELSVVALMTIINIQALKP